MASGQQWVLVEMVQAFYEVSFSFLRLCGVEPCPGVNRQTCSVSARWQLDSCRSGNSRGVEMVFVPRSQSSAARVTVHARTSQRREAT